uniref:Hepcidin antimicrobial peptide 3 n=1 Tax=Pagrus auriga TaxID=63415 RepID=B6ZJV1_PAGAU|nr:hepcidin antimicrobial peptide 3 [Pagrus auriga]BAH03291.1 hepcidin antimicrobial peptide 3 [Pagrus auriga]
MKTFSVAVAVAVVLTFICLQESSAVPVTEVPELEEEISNDDAAASYEETSVETWMMPFDIRQKPHSGLIKCSYCCDCCVLGVCGMCCQ